MDTARFESSHPQGRGWRVTLERPRALHTAHDLDSVRAVLAQADAAARDGLWAAVTVSYDAAPAFEPALRGIGRQPGVPLASVCVFERASREPRETHPPRAGIPAASPAALVLNPAISGERFVAGVQDAQRHIRDGDAYQVNLTFPLTGPAPPDPKRLFERLLDAQQAPYCAHIHDGRHEILSFSPELFFERRGPHLTTRPMKGTATRGRWQAEDTAAATRLRDSPKDRAENVMIVDLLRNDLGRVARVGSVHATELFAIERYPTLWQMTSTVEADVGDEVCLADLFGALFPCGSVTGAPKIRTMEIIAALEATPRGLYTGAIGFVEPGGDCTFSVAIRTLVIDHDTAAISMGVGAGITTDSVAEEEYQECLLKGRFATEPPAWTVTSGSPPWSLLETMRLEDGRVARLDGHLDRMRASAGYFGIPWEDERVRATIESETLAHQAGCWRLRLQVDRAGVPHAHAAPFDAPAHPRRWRVALAPQPVDANDPRLFNKTTDRRVYDAARAAHPAMDDVLLWNARGEITESTIANLVAELDGERVTPPVACGLLPGVLRSELVGQGALRERVITRADLVRASRLWLVNSLRGWIEATIEWTAL